MINAIDGDGAMARARMLALRGWGRTAPNPLVGCVLTADGEIIGEGWHDRLGGPHAEAEALAQAGSAARGATAWVTLEPCCHHGRTAPCTDALIAAGVRKVVCGSIDPNPSVRGKGIERLRAAGIEVITGVQEAECRALNRPFDVYMREHRSHVTVKMAVTLDGKSASPGLGAEPVTGEASGVEVQLLRARHQAVAVGVGTVLADDPRLTLRDPDLSDVMDPPWRIIFDSALRCPSDARVLADDGVPVFIVCCARAANSPAAAAYPSHVQLVVAGEGERTDPAAALRALADRECSDLLVEGGATFVGALEEQGLVDAYRLHIAPRVLGVGEAPGIADGPPGRIMAAARDFVWIRVERLGDDVLLEAARADLVSDESR